KTQGLERGEHTGRRAKSSAPSNPQVDRLESELRAHPCHECPEREDHARWAERYFKLKAETDKQRRQIENRTNVVARQFDRVCDVLDELGYLDQDRVTVHGRRLQRINSELDLVAGECIRHGTWSDLGPAELACVLSGLTFESRGADDPPAPEFPSGAAAKAAHQTGRIWADLERRERSHSLGFLREPDFAFAHAAWSWAKGASLDEALTEHEMAAGDFVRAV